MVWREEEGARQEALRAMGRGEAPLEVGVLTLSAEDTVSQLNFVGAEIWRRCDGRHTVEEIARELTGIFCADPERIAADVRTFVESLRERGWLVPVEEE